MRFILILLFALAAPAAARAGIPALLDRAVAKWIGGRDEWAFTQSVREFDGGQVREERLELYDPSQPGDRIWRLLAVNGRPATAERREAWTQAKLKKRLNPGKPLGEFFDFERATVREETATAVRYHVPLRNDHAWLFPTDRVNLRVTVDKATRAITQIEAGIDEPFRVALGLGRVMDLDFDVQMNPSAARGAADDPRAARPGGTARAVVNKLGQRVEYAWSGFRRVVPHPDHVIAVRPPPAG
jgi:hypothetical protein